MFKAFDSTLSVLKDRLQYDVHHSSYKNESAFVVHDTTFKRKFEVPKPCGGLKPLSPFVGSADGWTVPFPTETTDTNSEGVSVADITVGAREVGTSMLDEGSMEG